MKNEKIPEYGVSGEYVTGLHDRIIRAPRDRRFSDPELSVAFGTFCGPTRSENQDCVAGVQFGYDLAIVVCDGVASKPFGFEVASYVTDHVLKILSFPWNLSIEPTELTQAAISNAHYGARNMYRNRAATTIVCSSVIGGRCVIGWVGDSRVYGVRDNGVVEQLTTDDTIRAHVERHHGRSCPEASRTLVQAVGVDEEIEPHVLEVGPGYRRLVLVTDGAYCHGLVSDEVLINSSPDEVVGEFLDRLLGYDGRDNATVAVLDLHYQVEPMTSPRYLV